MDNIVITPRPKHVRYSCDWCNDEKFVRTKVVVKLDGTQVRCCALCGESDGLHTMGDDPASSLFRL